MKLILLKVGALVGALTATYACCKDMDLGFGGLRGTLSFSFDVALNFEFEGSSSGSFDWDWSEWSGVSAASDASLDFESGGDWTTFEQTVETDIDDDGVLETVTFLGVSPTGSADDVTRGFATWKGDKYTYDEGYCYLMTWDQSGARVMSAPCEDAGPAAVCSIEEDSNEDATCEACDSSGACTPCPSKKGEVGECLSDAEDELGEAEPPAAMGGSSSGVGIDGSVGASVELDLCLSQARTLSDHGVDCGEAALDADAVCEESLLEVEACLLAVEAVGLFGSPCGVIDSTSCGGLY